MFIRYTAIGLVLGAGVLAEFAEDVFWIVSHGPLTATRLDPIMSPGDISGHVHAIVGGSNFGPTYDYDRSIKSECTTANVGIDDSNYWVPQMYNKNDNGTVSLAGLSYANTYYQMRRNGDEPVYEFPPGFRMLAGDPNRRTFDESDPAQDAVRYVCLGTNIPEGHEFPKGQCKDGMRAQIYFPHCWDGINNWLEGSKHVSYGAGRFDGGGQCPPTHPKRIMGLFYEFIFHDHAAYKEGRRVWSNGDNVGYSLHADFTNGWPTGFFSKIFSYGKQCSVGFDLKSCPAIAPHVISGQNCQYKGVKVVEDIGDRGAIPKLPGNNPSVAGYKEFARFNSGSPAPAAVASIRASGIIMGTVKGDTPQSAPPDAVLQTGISTSRSTQTTTSHSTQATTSRSTQATTSTVVSTSTVASTPTVATSSEDASDASTSSGTSTTVTSAQSDSSSSIAATSTDSAVPGGAGVLIGDSSSSDSASASASATATDDVSTSGSGEASASATASDEIPTSFTSGPASVSTANGSIAAATRSGTRPDHQSSVAAHRPGKACGRGRRRRPHRHAT